LALTLSLGSLADLILFVGSLVPRWWIGFFALADLILFVVFVSEFLCKVRL
jgi:hypothetical protein